VLVSCRHHCLPLPLTTGSHIAWLILLYGFCCVDPAMVELEDSICGQSALHCCVLQCHRRNEAGVDVVFPVNAIAYNPTFGTFATGGGDGVVNFWDGGNKKRLVQVGGHSAATAS